MEGETHPTAALPAAFERSLAMLVYKLGDEVSSRSADGLSSLGLTGRAYVVLAVIADDQPRSQLDLARMIGKVPALIVAVVDELERAGLVDRRRSDSDRRRIIIELTPKGRRVLNRADQLVARVEDDLFGTLSNDEREAVHNALRDALRATWRPR